MEDNKNPMLFTSNKSSDENFQE